MGDNGSGYNAPPLNDLNMARGQKGEGRSKGRRKRKQGNSKGWPRTTEGMLATWTLLFSRKGNHSKVWGERNQIPTTLGKGGRPDGRTPQPNNSGTLLLTKTKNSRKPGGVRTFGRMERCTKCGERQKKEKKIRLPALERDFGSEGGVHRGKGGSPIAIPGEKPNKKTKTDLN